MSEMIQRPRIAIVNAPQAGQGEWPQNPPPTVVPFAAPPAKSANAAPGIQIIDLDAQRNEEIGRAHV